jgi:hypothetical protein
MRDKAGRGDEARRGRFQRATTQLQGRSADEGDEQPEAQGPALRLHFHREKRFEQYGIKQQGREGAEIRGAIEEIRVLRLGVAGAREPGLQKRAIAGHGKERQSDREQEDTDEPESLPFRRRCAKAIAHGDRQRQKCDQQERDVQKHGMARREPCRRKMRVGIAREQQSLEHHHRDGPHSGRSTKMRQHHLREHRLDEEKQEGGGENRQCESGQQGRSSRCNRSRFHEIVHQRHILAPCCVGKDAGKARRSR